MEDETILELHEITKFFPGVKALENVSLTLKKGEIHSIVGENGAGKSTLMKIVSGAQPYSTGQMYFQNELVLFHSTKEAQEIGISMIYQEFNLIPELTVAENIFLGNAPRNKGFINWNKMNKETQELLDKLEIEIDPQTKVSKLSVAHMQMVEIARALSRDSKIIIMDEPTAALTDQEIETLFSLVEALKARGISIIYISHRMNEIFSLSDRITVLRDGQFVKTLNKVDTDYDEIVSLMVGQDLGEIYPERNYQEDKVVLEVNNFSGELVNNVSFDLHKGEILGVSGLLGAGNVELMEMIYSAKVRDSGKLILNGKEITNKTPEESIDIGIGLVPIDRKNEGAVLIRSVKENISLGSLDKITKNKLISKEKEHQNVDKWIKKLNIRLSNREQLVRNLSGGNQQKVVFAKVLDTLPDVLLLLEPTRGVDVGAKKEIYQIIDELAKSGKSIILVSSDFPEVVGLSDRILVMKQGEIVQEIPKEKATQELILAHASGGVS